ncbi:MAG: DnaJ domain-containing protein [Rhodospirillales bacterium]|nr:DnaJ domain-containing protein [Rhodospirillales bacterium]
MPYLLAGTGLLILIWAFAWIAVNASASRVIRWTKWIIATLLTVAVIVLLSMGKPLPAAIPGVLLFPILLPGRRSGRDDGEDMEEDGQPVRIGRPMTIREAAEVLGVAENASVEEVKEAHRVLMEQNHPDKGGSPWFARQINEARDTLLAGRR